MRTVAGPWWLLLATIPLTVVIGVAVTTVLTCGADGCRDDTTKLSLTGLDLGQALVVVLAALVVSGEYMPLSISVYGKGSAGAGAVQPASLDVNIATPARSTTSSPCRPGHGGSGTAQIWPPPWTNSGRPPPECWPASNAIRTCPRSARSGSTAAR